MIRPSRLFSRPTLALLLLAGMLLGLIPGAGTAQAGESTASPAAPAATHTITLYADADAYVDQNTPSTNYATADLQVGVNKRTFVKFNLTGLPANATIQSAALRLRTLPTQATYTTTVSLGRVDANWTETTITWSNKPGVTASNVSTDVNYPGGHWENWSVTPVAQAWHDGSQPNYGFALAAASGQDVYFYSKETGFAPRLVIQFTLPPEEDPDQPVPPGNPFSDLGDAPDSSNNHGQNNTAYPGVLGRFPTVYQNTPANQPAGPRHVNASMEAILGNAITREQGADGGADADGVNNILRDPPPGSGGVTDTADNDRGDDGWRNPDALILNCRRVDLVVTIRKAATAQRDTMYLNAWFDGNRDGDWQDTGVCQRENGQQARSYEWMVQDHQVDLSAIPPGSSQTITVTSVLVYNPADTDPQTQGKAHWVRFTLSDRPAPRNPATNLADGRGPNPNDTPSAYAFGETEDSIYKLSPPEEPDNGELILQKAVEVNSTPVAYADLVTYRIRLENTKNRTVQAEIQDVLPYPLHVLSRSGNGGRVFVEVKEISPGVSPLNAQIDYRRQGGRLEQIVRWEGSLAPGAKVELLFDVHVHPVCGPNVDTVTITNTATLHKANGAKMDEKSVDFQAACPGYSPADIQVGQELVTDEDSTNSDSLSPGGRPALVTTFTNMGSQARNLGFQVEIERMNAGSAAVDVAATTRKLRTGRITLEPGQIYTVETPLDLMGMLEGSGLADSIPDDPSQEMTFVSRVRYAPLADDEATFRPEELTPEQMGQHEFPFKYRPWDLGDAPDSSNHFAAAMAAYPGVPANFPTVFDPATGAPPGPRHARPRPFHLGKRVEFEPDADLGAMPRNIVPPANVANRDRYDDGVNLGSIAFQNCQTATFQARVFISAAGQAALLDKGLKTAYINAWVDSNRDGDWADAAQCPQGSAPEHIVIDQPVDIASLTPGLNIVTVTTTGPVPWSLEMTDRPAWLRIMLSEEKSVKLAGQGYGDGRGPATGYRTGETEDYLWRPKGQGADPTVDLDVHWEPLPVDPPATPARKVSLRIHYRNQGSDPLVDSRIVLTLPTVLQNATLLRAVSVPDLGALDTDSPLAISLGDLAPGQQGTIVYAWKVEEGASVSGAALDYEKIVWTVRLEGKHPNGDLINNESLAQLRVDRSTPLVLGFTPLEGGPPAPNATTSRNSLNVVGTAAPNSTLLLLVDEPGNNANRKAAAQFTVPVGPNGNWGQQLTAQIDGLYRVRAVYSDQAAAASAADELVTLQRQGMMQQESRKFRVATSLPVDPLTMRFTDAQGRSVALDTLGWNRGNVQLPPMRSGQPFTITVQQTPGKTNVGLRLDLQAPFDSRFFQDLGGGTLGWSGCLTCIRSRDGVPTVSVPYALVTLDNGAETQQEGSFAVTDLGRITDGATGQPVSGASVRLLVQAPVSDTVGSVAVFSSWNSGGGQVNPQSTGGDGGYLFTPPAGTYRVQVSAPGYQSYTSDELEVADGDPVALDIILWPALSGQPDLVVELGPAGFEPSLLTLPPGTTVRWVNVDRVVHSVAGSSSSRSGSALSGFDSGLLSPGESFTLTLGQAGSYSLSDAGDPFNQGSLVVDPGAPSPGTRRIFLPVVAR